MTKTMIDRELLERIMELMHIIDHRQDDYGVEALYLGNILAKVLAQPAQQGEAVYMMRKAGSKEWHECTFQTFEHIESGKNTGLEAVKLYTRPAERVPAPKW